MTVDTIDWDNTQFVQLLDQCLHGADNIFVQARAGCGKSTIIKLIMDHMDNVVVLSTTGTSASDLSSQNVPAYTIHSFFKIQPLDIFTADDYVRDIGKNKSVLSKAKLIIIDEVSMMTNQLFDLIIQKMMHLLDGNLPRFLLFGDILQLPPVVRLNVSAVSQFYKDTYDGNVMFFNSTSYKKLNFKIHTLSKSYRQKDPVFSAAIRRISIGDIDQELLDYFNQRVVTEQEFASNFSTYMYMSPTNKIVDQRNKEYLESLSGKAYKFSTIVEKVSSDFNKKTLPKDVELKVGSQAMILVNNYGASDKYTYSNGMCGEIESITCNGDESTSKVVINVPKHGKKVIKYRQIDVMEVDVVGNNIVYETKCSYKYMPCVPCKAITIHKSQGKTLNATYLNLDNWIPDSIVYVAISRAENLESIGLSRPLTFSDFKPNKESIDFISNYEV
jgi:ATP-dependent exoDNAse (exonuclease V) alpha subunit